MLDQEEVGLLSAKKTKRTPESNNETRVVLGLVGSTTLAEGEHSWHGALLKVAPAFVSVMVVIKNEEAGVVAMILAILSQTVHRR
jgi:hypothetical protein